MLYLKSASGICDIFLGLRIVFDVQRGVRDIFLVVRTDSVFFFAGNLKQLVLKIFIFSVGYLR
jgi:hypothetical protein